MILFNACIAIFAIFIFPQIFLYRKYAHLNYSFIVIYGLIVSYTGSWLLSFLMFYLDLPYFIIQIIFYSLFPYALYNLLVMKTNKTTNSYIFIWILVFILLLPLLNHLGMGFSVWDALASWNKWGLELFENVYYPIDAAYPVLIPSLWSLIYKMQGTSEVWWTAQIILFILPLFILSILFILYSETKNKSYIFMVILIYPYLLSIHTINGNMDMPVMLMGFLSLVALYTASLYKHKIEFEYYVYASLLFAGIASIVKQAGIAFIVFDLMYILLNLKLFTHKKRLFIVIALSISYMLSYLSMYYLNNTASPTGNLKHLAELSAERLGQSNLKDYIEWLYYKFFQLPEILEVFTASLSLLKIKLMTPIFLIIAMILFLFKDLRDYKSVSFLSFIAFLLGTILWVQFFSYDERNALWVKAFLIIFISIHLNYLMTKYTSNILYSKIFFFTLIAGILFFVFSLGDKFTNEVQVKSQMNAGARYGCMPSIKYAVKLLKDKEPCVKIYTNELPLPQNYLLKPYKDKIILMGRDYKFQSFAYLKHDCEAGRYIIFRKNSMGHRYEWSKVSKLVNDGIIRPIVDENVLAYFVPPHISIDKNYFLKTDFVLLKLLPFKRDIKYFIDTYKEDALRHSFVGWAFIEGVQIDESKKYILLSNKNYSYIIRMHTQQRPDVSKNFNGKHLNNSGFISSLYKSDFPKGTYDVSLLLIDKDDVHHRVEIDKKIIF